MIGCDSYWLVHNAHRIGLRRERVTQDHLTNDLDRRIKRSNGEAGICCVARELTPNRSTYD